jgi:hypothetical protein
MRERFDEPVRRRGRGKSAHTLKVQQAIIDLLSQQWPMAVRQVFYQMVVRGIIEKTEAWAGYGIVQWSLAELRKSGDIPFSKVVDNGRGVEVNRTFTDTTECINDAIEYFRLSALDELSSEHVQVWIEKNALAAVIRPVCREHDVPLIVTTGTPSLSLSYEAAQNIMRSGKGKATIYIFTDYDPSGNTVIAPTIARHVREILSMLGSDVELSYVHAALTREQVDEFNLPTRPTKRSGNRHALKFDDEESVELDALTTDQLQAMVRLCLLRHIPEEALEELRARQNDEADRAREVISKLELD